MSTSAEVAEAVARHNVRNRKMTGVLTVSALLDELDRLHKLEEAARTVVDLDEPVAYGGAMWELRERLGPPS